MATSISTYTISVPVRSLDHDDLSALAETANQSGLIDVIYNAGSDAAIVSILADDGTLEDPTRISILDFQEIVAREAVDRGYVDFDNGAFDINVAQFDIWSAQYVFQIAAYGKEVVA